MSDIGKVRIIGLCLILCAIPGGWLGYNNSGATGIGGALIGGLSGGSIGFSLIAILTPKSYFKLYRGRGETNSTVVLMPLGSILAVCILVMYGFFFRFLINHDVWYRIIEVAVIVGLLAIVRMAIASRNIS